MSFDAFQNRRVKVQFLEKLASWVLNSSFIHAQEVVQSCKSQCKPPRHGAQLLPLVYLCSNYAIILQQTGSLWKTARHAVALCLPPGDSPGLTTQSAFRRWGLRGQRRFFVLFCFCWGGVEGADEGVGGGGRGLGSHVIKVYLTVDLCARPFTQAFGGLRSRNNAGLSSKLELQQSRAATQWGGTMWLRGPGSKTKYLGMRPFSYCTILILVPWVEMTLSKTANRNNIVVLHQIIGYLFRYFTLMKLV